MVAALEQLVASTDGGIIGAGSIRGEGLAAGAMLLLAGHNGAGSVQDVVALAGSVRALAVALLVLIDKVLLCWGLHHVDEHGLDLDATWVMLDVDLAEHDCWGLVEHNWGGLDYQWRMVHQHLGGWATHNDGCRTMDQNLALVLWVGDRGGEGVALGVHRLVGNVLVGAVAALTGLGDASGIGIASQSAS